MKDQLMLLVAVVAGLAATALAFVYIDSATAGVEEPEPANLVSVLITMNDLPANAVIDSETDLRTEMIDADLSPGIARGAVRASDRSSVDGRPVSSPLPAGVPLLYSHLTPIQDVNLAPGMRAMAITVSSEHLMGGLLVPGDYVDIMVSYELPKQQPESDPVNPGSGTTEDMISSMMGDLMGSMGAGGASRVPSDWMSEEVLSEVRVIAVGSALSGSRQAQMYGMSGGQGGRSSTITLELASFQAKDLIRAQAGGDNPLTLLLRPKASSSSTTGSQSGN